MNRPTAKRVIAKVSTQSNPKSTESKKTSENELEKLKSKLLQFKIIAGVVLVCLILSNIKELVSLYQLVFPKKTISLFINPPKNYLSQLDTFAIPYSIRITSEKEIQITDLVLTLNYYKINVRDTSIVYPPGFFNPVEKTSFFNKLFYRKPNDTINTDSTYLISAKNLQEYESIQLSPHNLLVPPLSKSNDSFNGFISAIPFGIGKYGFDFILSSKMEKLNEIQHIELDINPRIFKLEKSTDKEFLKYWDYRLSTKYSFFALDEFKVILLPEIKVRDTLDATLNFKTDYFGVIGGSHFVVRNSKQTMKRLTEFYAVLPINNSLFKIRCFGDKDMVFERINWKKESKRVNDVKLVPKWFKTDTLKLIVYGIELTYGIDGGVSGRNTYIWLGYNDQIYIIDRNKEAFSDEFLNENPIFIPTDFGYLIVEALYDDLGTGSESPKNFHLHFWKYEDKYPYHTYDY